MLRTEKAGPVTSTLLANHIRDLKKIIIILTLTNQTGAVRGKYWLEVGSVTKMTEGQYSSVRLLYGIAFLDDLTLLRFVNVRNLRLPPANFER